MTRAYCEAAVEVLDILNHTSEDKVNLIPTNFINYLKENAAKDYVVKLDYSKPINEMNVKIETMGILGTICRNWWWSSEQKQEYARLVREEETREQEELRKKYNPNDIFKKNSSISGVGIEPKKEKSNIALIENKKPKWYQNIFAKMSSLFNVK